jgi:hypothetical protein
MRHQSVLITLLGTGAALALISACEGAPGEQASETASALGLDGGGKLDGSSGEGSTGDGGDGGGASCEATLKGVGTVTCDKSIMVTESETLGHFSLQAVLDQVVATSGDSSLTALGLYQQLLDTLNDTANGVTSGPHCDTSDPANPNINGFPIQCPRQEGILAQSNPFTQGQEDSMFPVAVSNRFDLAPANGANCGQYRVLFAKNSGLDSGDDRFFLIFEAVLPNPSFVDDGQSHIAGCTDVASFWADLSKDTPTARGNKLSTFFFTGLKAQGFAPVIQASNYGFGNGGGTNTGQIRANMFMFFVGNQDWQLREFRLSQTCSGSSCTVVANNTLVQDNPFGLLFAPGQKLSASFQKNFLTQVPALAGANSSDGFTVINSIGMATPGEYGAGESDEQDQSTVYDEQGETTTFLQKITNELATIGRSDLTADNILNRATTQSCAGCHEVAVSPPPGFVPLFLGPGSLTWPPANFGGFVQVTETSQLSPALTFFFTPFRLQTLVNFLTSGAAQSDAAHTVGGGLVGAAN